MECALAKAGRENLLACFKFILQTQLRLGSYLAAAHPARSLSSPMQTLCQRASGFWSSLATCSLLSFRKSGTCRNSLFWSHDQAQTIFEIFGQVGLKATFLQLIELARHFKFFRPLKHLVDARFRFPVVFAENCPCEVLTQVCHFHLKLSQIHACSFLLLVKHGADLKYFIA